MFLLTINITDQRMNRKSDKERIALLAQKWRERTISLEEKQEFDDWYNSQNDNTEIAVPLGFGDSEQEVKSQLLTAIRAGRKHFVRRRVARIVLIRRVAAAAAVVAVVSLLTFFIAKDRSFIERSTAFTAPASLKEVQAGFNGAVLRLASGKELLLDSTSDGSLLASENINASKNKGELVYNAGALVNKTEFNTMITPRGRQYKLVLSDGTKVWLNAASSIRYPVVFTGKERAVQVSGEAFFDVAKDKSRPFIVNTEKQSITVLGTTFNVNAYPEDDIIQTTLLQGSVKVASATGKSFILKPGEQTTLEASELTVNKGADTLKVVAWKRGMFEFNNTSVPDLLKQISRWYDIDVRFEGTIADRKLGGGISKYLPLEKVLAILKKAKINFRYEKGVLIVTGNPES